MQRINSRTAWHMKRTVLYTYDFICVSTLVFTVIAYFDVNTNPDLDRWGGATRNQVFVISFFNNLFWWAVGRFFIVWEAYKFVDEVLLDPEEQVFIVRNQGDEIEIPFSQVLDIKETNERIASNVAFVLRSKSDFGEEIRFELQSPLGASYDSPHPMFCELRKLLGMSLPPFPELPDKGYYD